MRSSASYFNESSRPLSGRASKGTITPVTQIPSLADCFFTERELTSSRPHYMARAFMGSRWRNTPLERQSGSRAGYELHTLMSRGVG